MQFPPLLIIAGLSLVVSGCESWRFAAPVSDVSMRTPGSWAAASSGAEGRISSGWLSEFGDADLTRTVNDALAHNRDLKTAATRLRVAEENSIIARSRMLPSAGLSGSAAVTDCSGSDRRQSHGLNLAAAWEPDLWSRLRNLTNAAEAEQRAALEDFRGARLSLAANTAKAWCNLISAGQEVTLANVTLESFEKNLRIIERNHKGTGEGALDIQYGRYPAGTSRNHRDLPQRRPASRLRPDRSRSFPRGRGHARRRPLAGRSGKFPRLRARAGGLRRKTSRAPLLGRHQPEHPLRAGSPAPRQQRPRQHDPPAQPAPAKPHRPPPRSRRGF